MEGESRRSQWTVACWAILIAVGGYYLWGWHREHVLQLWPAALFLLCPLMHVLGHRHHGSHEDRKSQSEPSLTGSPK